MVCFLSSQFTAGHKRSYNVSDFCPPGVLGQLRDFVPVLYHSVRWSSLAAVPAAGRPCQVHSNKPFACGSPVDMSSKISLCREFENYFVETAMH